MGRNEAIEAIKVVYPKHTKQAYSLASRPDETGVRFTAEAERIRKTVLSGHRKDSHKKRYRFMVRVTEERYSAVKLLITESGFKTVNEWLDWLISEWEKGKAASVAGTTESGTNKHSKGIISPGGEKVNG